MGAVQVQACSSVRRMSQVEEPSCLLHTMIVWLPVLLIFALWVAYKMGMLSKAGYSLVGLGCAFLAAGAFLVWNPLLLFVGQLLVFGGFVLICGVERAKLLTDILKRNQCCKPALVNFGLMAALLILADFLNNFPFIWRFYDRLPVLAWVTKHRSDYELT